MSLKWFRIIKEHSLLRNLGLMNTGQFLKGKFFILLI